MEEPAADRDQLEKLLRGLERIERGAARGIPAICLGWGTEGTLGLQHQGACLGMHGAKPADLLAMVRQRLADLGQDPEALPAPLVAAECPSRPATKKPPDLPSEGFKGSVFRKKPIGLGEAL